jgi:hypothetical protein
MVRWVRLASVVIVILAMLGLGAAGGLFVAENVRWVPIDIPRLLAPVFGARATEVWMPALFGGWLVAIFLLFIVVASLALRLVRARRAESQIRSLEREVVLLRNMPFNQPAPFEDLPEEDLETPPPAEDASWPR